MLFTAQDSAKPASRKKSWPGLGAIAALITASTGAILLCPCDCIGRNRRAIFLVALSIALGLAAAFLVFRRMKENSGITQFLKAVSALAIVGASIYAELAVATEVIAWLAAHGG